MGWSRLLQSWHGHDARSKMQEKLCRRMPLGWSVMRHGKRSGISSTLLHRETRSRQTLLVPCESESQSSFVRWWWCLDLVFLQRLGNVFSIVWLTTCVQQCKRIATPKSNGMREKRGMVQRPPFLNHGQNALLSKALYPEYKLQRK